MLEKLRDSLLTEKHAQRLQLQPMTESMAATLGVNPAWAGFKIPYFHPNGKVVKDFYRYRFWPDSKPSSGWAALTEPAKPLRYVQPAGSELHVYMPPLLPHSMVWDEVMEHPDVDISITEGELKSACICAQGGIMLGLGGVFSWTSKKHQQALIPILESFDWADRRVDLVFDSDRAVKPLVQLAASRLALMLLSKGARPYDVLLPWSEDGAKMGVDDFVVRYGYDAYLSLVKYAKPSSAAAELHRLNEEVGLIKSGGPIGNVVRLEDGQIITPNQFTRSVYSNRTYTEYAINKNGEAAPPKVKYAAEEWLRWPFRTAVTGITYSPGREQLTARGEYNLWRPSSIVPAKGDCSPWDDLVKRVCVNVGPEQMMWFRRWMAFPLQNPGTKLFSCVLVWSHKGGTGKNLLAEALVPIYGASNCVTIKSRQLTGDFNGWAEGKQFVIGDEIALDDKRHTSGDLKSMLTNRTIRINRKGIESYELPDCTNYYFTSNDPVAIMLDQGERRTFVIHAPEQALGDAYGRRFAHWLRHGHGAAAIAYQLLHLDLGDFSPTAEPPATEAKVELIANSRSDIDTWAAALRTDPDKYLGGPAKYGGGGGASVYTIYTPEDLIKLYDPDDRKRTSHRAMGIALDRAGFRKARWNSGVINNVRSTFWIMRGDDLSRAPISSASAAKLYQEERPQFVPPSERGKDKKNAKPN